MVDLAQAVPVRLLIMNVWSGHLWCRWRWMWCIWNISSSDWLTGRGRGFSPAVYILLFRVLYFPHYISYTIPCTTIYKQSGALSLVRSIEILCSYWLGLLCCWRQLSYSIKTQAKVPKVSIRGISCLSMCLYGIKGWLPCTERIKQRCWRHYY